MQEVRRGVVDDVDVGIGGKRFEAAVGLGHAERVGFGASERSSTSAIATTSTNPSRRTASTWCIPTKPGPTRPIPIRWAPD